MDIRVQSVKFDADVKLLEFIDKKVGKLDKFYEDIINAVTVEVTDSASLDIFDGMKGGPFGSTVFLSLGIKNERILTRTYGIALIQTYQLILNL